MRFPVATFARSADEGLVLLERLLEMASCEKRGTHLLREAECNADPGWFLYAPPIFNAALDIRLDTRQKARKPYPIWTQGNQFAFDRGDILYDTPVAYKGWKEALRVFAVCVQVVYASPATQPKGQIRQPGRVGFRVSEPSKDRHGLVVTASQECTQDEFVRYAITGKRPGQ